MQILNKQLIKQFLPENPVILEAGAHKGRDTLKMHQLWPKAIIYAFEPVPHLYEELQKAVEGIANIKTFNLALSHKTGSMSMYISPELGAVSSLLKPTIIQQQKPNISFEKISVPTITLDDFAQQNKIKKIDFLWLDLQGYELAALKAGINILKTVRAIYTESSLEQRYEGQALYNELKDFLENQEFYLVAQNFHHTTWGNVFFVRKNS